MHRPPPMVTATHPTAPLTSFNQRLMTELRAKKYRHQPHRLVRSVKNIISEIKEQKLKFDQTTYNCLLTALKQDQNVKEILQTLEEMEEQGVPPSIESYHIALETVGNAKCIALMFDLKDAMIKQGIQPTSHTYHIMIKSLCYADSLEEALDVFHSLGQPSTTTDTTAATIEPSPLTYTLLIQACLRVHHVGTAYSLLQQAESKNVIQDAMAQSRIYMNVLRAGADADRLDMVNHCWKKAIHEQKSRPDEGVLLNTSRVAAKYGQPTLVTDIIRTLGAHGYPYKEHYFTPLMEAFLNSTKNSSWLSTNKSNSSNSNSSSSSSHEDQQEVDADEKDLPFVKNLKNAFQVLDIMRISGITPTMRTAQPILTYLRGNVKKVDAAYFVLEEMRKKENRNIDVTAFNVVVAACAQLGDMERTIATYREASHLGVTIDVDTCNAVLDACISTAMKGMGTILIEDMKKEGIQPNMETYTKMIELALTQRNYEDAFVYLEEMKGYDIVPPQRCYMKLAQKLARERDPRFHMVIEELDTYGYKISNERVKQLWNNTPNDNEPPRRQQRSRRYQD
ncbi:hypothetical protein BDF20DRAFT_840339 [Mycotypha africana]|uniref:uncharacterized protein n=1 Tax=Mycotypha africana TaxID=64632 RepID=UPI00230020CC|nr:uncharacterized protein BDF20DRAFT_840339 [Mycotypha africana]KAI8967252.1 hypothetical protein BDF20DRAFT_840339 [Mycotypha africana]